MSTVHVDLADDRAERVRGLGQSVDLGLEGHDLVAGIAKGRGEPLILAAQLIGLGAQPGHLLDVDRSSA